MYPFSSSSTPNCFARPFEGSSPIATKTASVSYSSSTPSLTRVTEFTAMSPLISLIVEFQRISTPFSCKSSSRRCSHLKLSLLWTILTLHPMFLRYNASCAALFPPPTMRTFLFTKNMPSQVAQYATPLPRNSFSPGTFKCLWDAPVAKITDLVRYSLKSSPIEDFVFM